MADKEKTLKGREAVDAYRLAHTELHSKPWTRDVPALHTPLLEKMLKDLSVASFKSIQEFFNASDELNIQELGLEDKELTEADIIAIEGKWH